MSRVHSNGLYPAAIAFMALLFGSLLLLGLSSTLEGLTGFWVEPTVWLLSIDAGQALDTLSNAAEVVAGVLAIAMTVVAIVVELAATRYTHRITVLFLSEPINVIVMSFFVLTTVQCLWVAAVLGQPGTAEALLPNAGLAITMAMVTVCLLVLLPYFLFVFSFLSPLNILERLKDDSIRSVERVARGRPALRGAHAMVECIEEIEDVARSAVEHSDRGIAMAGVDSLMDLMMEYQPNRHRLPELWFDVHESVRRNPDFVSMAPTVLAEVNKDRVWVEVKILRQYQTLFGASVNRARDVCNLIGLNTQSVGVYALHESEPLFRLCVRSFNSYLRASINAKDVRTAYYLFNQYRLLAEAALRAERNAELLEISEHFRYYGQIGFQMGQPFLLEAAAFDLVQLAETALELDSPIVDPLLALILEVDKEGGTELQEEGLLGVRRAQVQLATVMMERGFKERALLIADDMRGERVHRLEQVRDELLTEDRELYWEFTDRGVNFNYLAPSRRKFLAEFFSWLNIESTALH